VALLPNTKQLTLIALISSLGLISACSENSLNKSEIISDFNANSLAFSLAQKTQENCFIQANKDDCLVQNIALIEAGTTSTEMIIVPSYFQLVRSVQL
tara:strand:+ start:36662 stop:36955 length:294 start_codon:yes stop_codon:yes gene_type:complete